MIHVRHVTFVLALAALIACRPDDQRTETIDPAEAQRSREELPEELIAHLDSGGAAFRRDDYQTALDHYRSATEIGPDVAAAWFGVYMAQQALGNAAAADSALARVQSIAPGASLVHPRPADTAGAGT